LHDSGQLAQEGRLRQGLQFARCHHLMEKLPQVQTTEIRAGIRREVFPDEMFDRAGMQGSSALVGLFDERLEYRDCPIDSNELGFRHIPLTTEAGWSVPGCAGPRPRPKRCCACAPLAPDELWKYDPVAPDYYHDRKRELPPEVAAVANRAAAHPNTSPGYKLSSQLRCCGQDQRGWAKNGEVISSIRPSASPNAAPWPEGQTARRPSGRTRRRDRVEQLGRVMSEVWHLQELARMLLRVPEHFSENGARRYAPHYASVRVPKLLLAVVDQTLKGYNEVPFEMSWALPPPAPKVVRYLADMVAYQRTANRGVHQFGEIDGALCHTQRFSRGPLRRDCRAWCPV